MAPATLASRARRKGRPSLRRTILWLVLAIPAALMIQSYAGGEMLAMDMLHPSGEVSLRLMLLAMLIGPIIDIFGRNRLLLGWLSIRRNLGVAAFAHAVLHLAFYVADMGALAYILDELPLPGIWTGWLSFVLMLAAASISTDWAVRRLGRWWKRVQTGVYAVFLLAAIHWWLLERDPVPALIHLVPLLIAWSLRWFLKSRRRDKRKELSL